VDGLVIVNEVMTAMQMGEDMLDIAVREHARLIYRITYSVLRNHHDAEDATQETFMRVLRYRNKLEEVRDARNWLARIAWRIAVERRSQPRHLGLEYVGDEVVKLRSSCASAEEMLLRTEMTGLLERLIAGLPDKLRDPLTLSSIEEMSPVDIAKVLGINQAAVRSRLFRARQILKEKLETLLGEKHGT
jgi:RNA polymerase sigma-70 factor (ECF subfamily)